MFNKTAIALISITAAVVVAFGGAAIYIAATDNGKSTAQEICEEFATGMESNTPAEEEITKEQYLEYREAFSKTGDEALNAAGTELIDLVWEISQLSGDDEFAALGYLTPVTSAYTSLISACAAYDVILPSLFDE